MKSIFYFDTSIGRIGIAEEDNFITNVIFENDKLPVKARNEQDMVVKQTELLKEAGLQLTEYLAGQRKDFTLPLAPEGTAFMKKVWECLCNIPYGETRSYRDVAEAAGNSKACRAVGLANNRNPIPLFIPCHRVIGTDGRLTGYRGGLELKNKLLEMEKKL